MKKDKTILFILDSFELYPSLQENAWPKKTFCYSYLDTEEAIKNNMKHIVTYDIGHLSFDLEFMGYSIFIGHNGHTKEIYSGMATANGKEIRFGHNLRKLLIGGAFDNDLGLNIQRGYPSSEYLINQKKWKEDNIQESRDNFMYDYVNGYLEEKL